MRTEREKSLASEWRQANGGMNSFVIESVRLKVGRTPPKQSGQSVEAAAGRRSVGIGERTRLACCFPRPRGKLRRRAKTRRWGQRTRQRQPRGRGWRHPGRVRSPSQNPIQAWIGRTDQGGGRNFSGWGQHCCVPSGHGQPQGGCGLQPKVAPSALPWVTDGNRLNPNGVVAWAGRGRNPVGVGGCVRRLTQGSSGLATLGWRAQPLWGWKQQSVASMSARGAAH